MEEKDVQQQVAELQTRVTKFLEMEQIVDLLKKNVIEFEYEGTKYRVSKPSFRQRAEVNERRIVKFTELLKNPTMMMEKDLIEIYKTRGIDIDELDAQKQKLEKERNDLMMKLGEGLKDQTTNSDLLAMKKEIKRLYELEQEVVMKKILYLDTSIETQVNVFVITYLAFLVTEKKDGDNWIRAWTDYDAFMNQPDALVNTITFYVSFVSRAELPK